MDPKAFLRGEIVRIPGRGFAGFTQAPLAKPWIAAVEGYAIGGGFEIALTCDLIVAGDSARFGLLEVKRGLVANAAIGRAHVRNTVNNANLECRLLIEKKNMQS